VPSLKTALALITALAAVAAAGAAVVFALQRSHDGVPEKVRACAEQQGEVGVEASEGMT
jgi:Flp pilus assembly protein CpaB